jgi:hypothetical protein
MAQQNRPPTREIPIEMHVGEDAGAVGADDAVDAGNGDTEMALAGGKPAGSGKEGAGGGARQDGQAGDADRGRDSSQAGGKPGGTSDVADEDDEANQTTENQPS